jgi:hypothetical protein
MTTFRQHFSGHKSWEGNVKYLILAIIIFASMIVEAAIPTTANAARVCPNGGYCPPGTCAQFNGGRIRGGGSYACNVKNCSAKNCMH